MVLAFSLGAAPATVFAQDGPEAPVQALFDAIGEKRFDDLAASFCPEFADGASQLNIAAAMAASLPPGNDPQLAVDALGFSVEGLTLNVLAEEGDTANVSVEADLVVGLDPDTAGHFVAALLAASGLEPTEDLVAAMTGTITASISQEIPISEVVTVTRGEDGAWLICSELGGSDATPDPTAPANPSGAPEPSPSGEPA